MICKWQYQHFPRAVGIRFRLWNSWATIMTTANEFSKMTTMVKYEFNWFQDIFVSKFFHRKTHFLIAHENFLLHHKIRTLGL